MICILGKASIILSLVLGPLYFVLSRPKYIFGLQSISIIISFILLLYAFITSDFSVQNVFFYSSTKQPLIYKIASLWGNQDASLLFFAMLLSIIGLFVLREVKNDIALKIISILLTLIMIAIYFAFNPFIYIPKTPIEGLGMNPVLQDMAIAIHPPMLYIGYVTYIIPYACFLGMLLKDNMKDMEFAYKASKFALGFLSSGIALGSWWAYRELGWGGYWFFDPVENISLIPWLLGIALHHSFLVTMRSNGKLLRSTIILGLSNFLIIVFGVITVRSGTLASVHSFASGSLGGYYIIGVFALVIIVTSIVGFIKMPKDLKTTFSFQEKGIVLGNIITISATCAIIIGTFFPVIFAMFKGHNISLSNQYFYYTFVPLAISMALLMTFVPHMRKLFSFALNIKNSSMILSHLGVIILLVGITLNTLLNRDIEFIGKIGDKISNESTGKNITIVLRNIRYAEGPNYYRQIAEFWINYNNEIVVLKPENRLYKIENAISAESDIYSFVDKDIYVVLGSLEDDGTLHANIYIRPWMSMIWLGMFLIAIGIFLSGFYNVQNSFKT